MVTTPSRPVLTIALGFLLLVNPLYVGALHLDDPNWYRYETTEVTYGPDGLEGYVEPDGIDDDVACLRGFSRACNLEMRVLEQGTLSVEDPGAIPEWAYNADSYDYAYIDDHFYATETESRGEGAVLSLNRTAASVALEQVSTPLDRASRPIRRAVQSGSVETRHELDGANQLWERDGEYHVVYEVASHTYGPGTYREKVQTGRVLERALSLLGIAVGLLFVLRGQRRRVEREPRG